MLNIFCYRCFNIYKLIDVLTLLQTSLFVLLNTTFYSVKHNFSYCVKHNCTIIILEFLNTITSYNFLLIIVLCCMLPSRALLRTVRTQRLHSLRSHAHLRNKLRILRRRYAKFGHRNFRTRKKQRPRPGLPHGLVNRKHGEPLLDQPVLYGVQ